MKIIFLLMVIMFTNIVLADDEEAHTGVVRIEGTITEKTCIIADQSKDFTVNMPDVPSIDVREIGAVSAKTNFTVTLTRCGADVNNAVITFSGSTMAEDTALYKLEEGGVDGLGLIIFDRNEKQITNNIKSENYPLTPSVDNTLSFYAAYKSVKNDVQPGPANASVSFVVTYE
jgi:major type 1 subunit fimbrin (pilin)